MQAAFIPAVPGFLIAPALGSGNDLVQGTEQFGEPDAAVFTERVQDEIVDHLENLLGTSRGLGSVGCQEKGRGPRIVFADTPLDEARVHQTTDPGNEGGFAEAQSPGDIALRATRIVSNDSQDPGLGGGDIRGFGQQPIGPLTEGMCDLLNTADQPVRVLCHSCHPTRIVL
nr:hypothetical protein [Nocardia lijiangensis]